MYQYQSGFSILYGRPWAYVWGKQLEQGAGRGWIMLANRDQQVITFTGDGGSMYTIQALHTASRYHIPIKIVICNNKRYHLLDQNLEVYRRERGIAAHQLPDCFSMEPVVDFVTLARSMGVDGIKAETPKQAADAAKMLLQAKEAFLVDLNTI